MATSKKILPFPATLALGSAADLCETLAKKFVDPSGAPHFQFKVAEGYLWAEGEAWAKKGSERPAMGTMASYAEGYLQCLMDNAAAIAQYNEPASQRG